MMDRSYDSIIVLKCFVKIIACNRLCTLTWRILGHKGLYETFCTRELVCKFDISCIGELNDTSCTKNRILNGFRLKKKKKKWKSTLIPQTTYNDSLMLVNLDRYL